MRTDYVYLLHYYRPITYWKKNGKVVCVQHYMGSAKDGGERIEHHRNGSARCKLTDAFFYKGIGFQVAKIWWARGKGRKLERLLKNRHNHSKLCPICKTRETYGDGT